MNKLFDKAIIIKENFERGGVFSALYFGTRFKCPICGSSLRKFIPYGQRSNARCPGCGSLERHRLMWLFLNNETTIFNDKLTLLHFAPERFFLDRFMKMTNLSYTPADINPSLPLIKKIDIIDIPMNDNHYDCVICCHVLEHVHDDQKAMREIYRVLKPGGWAILQVPIGRLKTFEDHAVQTPQDRQRVFGQHDHVRIYGLDYVTRLETAGFKVNVINYAKKVSDEKIRKYALSQKDIYLCSKERAS